MATYNITSEKLQELNELINTGGQIPSAVNAATGQTAALLDQNKVNEAKASNLNASKQNDKSGAAWSDVQGWHDSVKGENGGGGGGNEPTIPPNAIQMYGAGGKMTTSDGGDMAINGKNYACVVSPGQWQYAVATFDGDVASMSCDGKQIGFSVTDAPTDPGITGKDAAESRPYKKGQCLNIRIGEGGYSPTSAILFTVTKYG